MYAVFFGTAGKPSCLIQPGVDGVVVVGHSLVRLIGVAAAVYE